MSFSKWLIKTLIACLLIIGFLLGFFWLLYQNGTQPQEAPETLEIQLDTVFIVSNQLNLDEIYDTIVRVETRGEPDPNNSIGDNGMSYGQAQIQRKVIIDVNREFGLKLRHEDAFDPGQSRRIFKLYVKWLKKHVGVSTEEQFVRCWNGGPYGYRKESTVKYYKKYLTLKK